MDMLDNVTTQLNNFENDYYSTINKIDIIYMKLRDISDEYIDKFQTIINSVFTTIWEIEYLNTDNLSIYNKHDEDLTINLCFQKNEDDIDIQISFSDSFKQMNLVDSNFTSLVHGLNIIIDNKNDFKNLLNEYINKTKDLLDTGKKLESYSDMLEKHIAIHKEFIDNF
jgi:hypothetical protein